MEMSSWLRSAAFHEAGHAVARIHVGFSATLTEVYADGSGMSHAQDGGICNGGSQYPVWNMLVVLLAGPWAEARYRKKGSLWVLSTTGKVDWRDAVRLMDWLTEHGFAADRNEAFERAEAETREMLKSRWNAIGRVAAALLQHRKLTADQVDALTREPAHQRP